MTSYADSAAFFLNYSLYYKYSLVLCYLLASFSENIDGDWLPRISASFLLIKEKEKNEGVYFNRISETFLKSPWIRFSSVDFLLCINFAR